MRLGVACGSGTHEPLVPLLALVVAGGVCRWGGIRDGGGGREGGRGGGPHPFLRWLPVAVAAAMHNMLSLACTGSPLCWAPAFIC